MTYRNAGYMIIEARDQEELKKRVEDLLQLSWLPQGGVCVTALGDDNYLYVQAMTFNVNVD